MRTITAARGPPGSCHRLLAAVPPQSRARIRPEAPNALPPRPPAGPRPPGSVDHLSGSPIEDRCGPSAPPQSSKRRRAGFEARHHEPARSRSPESAPSTRGTAGAVGSHDGGEGLRENRAVRGAGGRPSHPRIPVSSVRLRALLSANQSPRALPTPRIMVLRPSGELEILHSSRRFSRHPFTSDIVATPPARAPCQRTARGGEPRFPPRPKSVARRRSHAHAAAAVAARQRFADVRSRSKRCFDSAELHRAPQSSIAALQSNHSALRLGSTIRHPPPKSRRTGRARLVHAVRYARVRTPRERRSNYSSRRFLLRGRLFGRGLSRAAVPAFGEPSVAR